MRNLFFLAGMQDKRKRPSSFRPEGLRASVSVRRVAGFGARFCAACLRGDFRFRAAEPAHGVGAHTPEYGDSSSHGFLRFAVLGLVLRADELSVNQDGVALVERVRDRFAEAVEGHDCCGDGQHGEIRVYVSL
jgi:hypothetical protein